MKYAFSNNGESMRCVEDGWLLDDGEKTFDHRPSDDELAAAFPKYSKDAAALKSKIVEIETTITPRRMREAALTTSGKEWLADRDAEISLLRAQM